MSSILFCVEQSIRSLQLSDPHPVVSRSSADTLLPYSFWQWHTYSLLVSNPREDCWALLRALAKAGTVTLSGGDGWLDHPGSLANLCG